MVETPWSVAKAAFPFDGPYYSDNDKVAEYLYETWAHLLPEGWAFESIEQSGAAGYVVVFQIEDVIPTMAAGKRVARLIKDILKFDAHPLCAPCRASAKKHTWLSECDNPGEKMREDGWLFRHTCNGGNCVCGGSEGHTVFEDDTP